MPLATGQTLTHYEILEPLGAGGMGEVYRARDTRLEREVAIKVLPEHFADDEERLRRFEREALTLASLSHTNLAHVYGIDQVDDTCFIAMELVPGDDLAARLARGPLPVDEALDVCRQIAEGLEAAHEAGVVHRDLKPANVRITPEGVVKILDFGLAKPIHPRAHEEGTTTAESDSFLMTEEGLVLGTPTYMSPEQARGKPVDRRTDIWAFGCVLFECLTGKRAFAGENVADVLGAIVTAEPELMHLPAATPPRTRELVASCLHKNPRQRLRDIGDARLVLERVHDPADVPAPAARRTPLWIAWAVSLAVAVVLASRVGRGGAPSVRPVAAVRASILLPPDLDISGGESAVSLSPDGERLVLVAARKDQPPQLWVRTLDGQELQPLTGTERPYYPFWSPDGTRIGFFAEGALRTVPAAGGAVETICATASGRGATWGSDGTIVFSPGPFDPLMRVHEGGGNPVPVTTVDGSGSDRLPVFLPDGRHVLFYRKIGEQGGVHLLDLKQGEVRELFASASGVEWCEPGYLVRYEREGLVAQRFDPETFELSGAPRRIAEQVDFSVFRHRGRYSVARSGLLVYLGDLYRQRFRWRDADGTVGALGEVGRFDEFSISPDGSEVAVISIERDGEIVLRVLAADTGLSRVVASDVALQANPTWSPDGRRLAYGTVSDDQPFETHVVDLASGEVWRLPSPGWPSDWSRDGEHLALSDQIPNLGFELYVAPSDGSGEARGVLSSKAQERDLRFSPDGRFVLFGRGDFIRDIRLYVTSFPEPGPIYPVTAHSTYQGWWWLDDGRIAYRAQDGQIWSVRVDTEGDQPRFGAPEPMFGGARTENEDVMLSRDGTRLLETHLPDPVSRRRLNLLTGWNQPDQRP